MKYTLFVICIVVLLSNPLFSQESDFDNLFSLKLEISFNLDADTFLKVPIRVIALNDESLLWGETDSFYILSHSGEVVHYYKKIGGGPCEFRTVDAYTADSDGNIFVISRSKSSILHFRAGTDLECIGEYNLTRFRPRHISVYNEQLYLQNERIQDTDIPAITKIDINSLRTTGYGNIPQIAKLQSGIGETGGMDVDSDGNVYFGYLGMHEIIRLTREDNRISSWSIKPEYFKAPELAKVRSLNRSMDFFTYAQETTRLTGLFITSGDILIQQFEPDNYLLPGAKQRTVLEVWDTSGNKLATNVESPQKIAFISGDIIYFWVNFPNDLLSREDYDGAWFKGYQLNE